MNRREAIQALLGTPVPILAAGLTLTEVYGFVDVPRHVAFRHKGIWLRVFFNGEDVTNRCIEADDTRGEVLLQVHRNGKAFLNEQKDGVEQVRLTGAVRFVRAEPWA